MGDDPSMKVHMKSLFYCLITFSACAQAQDFSKLFERLKPTVVIVEAKKSIPQTMDSVQVDVDQSGLGSGVLVEKKQVLTAAHVVQTADSVTVHFHNKTAIKARVVASSPNTDVALLELDGNPAGLSPAPIGDSDKVKVGSQVFIIGAPYGLAYTLTTGHISNRIKVPEVTSRLVPLELFQTDAAINQGNSGGPLFNMKGEVIGVVSHILSKSGGFEGLGFATTTAVARETLINRSGLWTGAEAEFLSEEICRALNIPQTACLLIVDIAKDSLSDKLGLKAGRIPAYIYGQDIMLGGDIILSVGDITIETMDDLYEIQAHIEQFKAGDAFKVTVWREGQRVPLEIRP
jgi:S1-C subfamily serine protease